MSDGKTPHHVHLRAFPMMRNEGRRDHRPVPRPLGQPVTFVRVNQREAGITGIAESNTVD